MLPWVDSSSFPDDLPNALLYAASSTEAVVITEAHAPYKIMYVNLPWTELCEYEAGEAVGRTFRFMQGAETDAHALEQLVGGIQNRQSVQTSLINYKKSGRRFTNFLRVKPLSSQEGGEVSHFLGILRDSGQLHSAA